MCLPLWVYDKDSDQSIPHAFTSNAAEKKDILSSGHQANRANTFPGSCTLSWEYHPLQLYPRYNRTRGASSLVRQGLSHMQQRWWTSYPIIHLSLNKSTCSMFVYQWILLPNLLRQVQCHMQSCHLENDSTFTNDVNIYSFENAFVRYFVWFLQAWHQIHHSHFSTCSVLHR